MTSPVNDGQTLVPNPVLIGTGIVLSILFVLLIVLSLFLYSERTKRYERIADQFQGLVSVPVIQTNRLFTGYEDVTFLAIGLPKRKESHFSKLQKDLEPYNIVVNFWEGVNGKEIDYRDYPLADRYYKFFEDNIRQREAGLTKTDYRGHLGATLSHLSAIANMDQMTVVFEDDAVIGPDFRIELQKALAAVHKHDPQWEVLMLGFCCKYKDHFYCKKNDQEPVYEGGIVKLHYWFGAWGYVVRSHAAAQKILQGFDPIPWHIDLTMAEMAMNGQLRVYGCVPPLVNHPGYLRISSFDQDCYGDGVYTTDTNL